MKSLTINIINMNNEIHFAMTDLMCCCNSSIYRMNHLFVKQWAMASTELVTVRVHENLKITLGFESASLDFYFPNDSPLQRFFKFQISAQVRASAGKGISR